MHPWRSIRGAAATLLVAALAVGCARREPSPQVPSAPEPAYEQEAPATTAPAPASTGAGAPAEEGFSAGVTKAAPPPPMMDLGRSPAAKPSTADSMQYSYMFWEGLFTTQVKALANKKVGEIMSETPRKVDQNMNLMEIANLMFTSQIRRMLVTAEDKIVGVVREQELFFEIANIII